MHNTSNSEPMARVLSLVRGIKPAGHGWKAQCPAHDDKTPSLSITQGDNGCVLLKCHAGCETRAVVAALGLKESDLFEPTERARTTPRPKPVKEVRSFASAKEAADAYRATHKKETARWVYRDADGAPVGLVMRWDTSDGTKNIRPVWRIGDGWQHSIPSEQRPLYALDRLAADANARVFVAEGEKCADQLAALGLLATTSPSGASSAAKADWSPLAGREVVILPDADDAGCKYAEEVLGLLRALNPPARAAIAPLPGLTLGEDAVEFVERVHNGDVSAARAAIDELATAALAMPAPIATPLASVAVMGKAYGPASEWCTQATTDGYRWDNEAKAWHIRDSVGIWAPDRVNHVNGSMLYAAQVANPGDTGAWARYFQTVAASHKGLVTTSEQWDAGLLEVGTPGGVLDLCTGNILENGASRLVTKRLAALPAGTSPSWLKFLNEATNGDPDMMHYLQRWAGYLLSGSTQEHAIVFIHGPGGNGKSVFIDTIRHALGDYARTLPMDALMESRNDRHPAEIAMLRGVRLAVANETQEGRRWDEAKVKQLSGGDAVAARFMGKDWFQFRPTHKLVVVGNHAPTIGTIDEALRRRLHMVPFIHQPEAIDPTLGERLRSEVAGVLAWMLEGFKQWQDKGLAPPASVIDATNAYFEEQDTVGAWLAECCDFQANEWTSSSDLFNSWKHWCEQNGIAPKSMKRLAPELQRRRLLPERRTNARGFRGVIVTSMTHDDTLMTHYPNRRGEFTN